MIRREVVAAVALAVLGAVLVLLAASRTWAHASVTILDVHAPPVRLSGRALEPLPAALGLVALAGAVAVVATRGIGRVVVGAVLAFAGAGVISGALSVSPSSVQSSSALSDKVPTAQLRVAVVDVSLTAWRHVSAVGGLCLIGSGLLVAARGRQWSTMGRRYDAPTTPAPVTPDAMLATDTDETASLWERIDRGDDPTTDV